jgi:hypothetical protein
MPASPNPTAATTSTAAETTTVREILTGLLLAVLPAFRFTHRYAPRGEADSLTLTVLGGPNVAHDKLENKLHDLVCDGTMTLRNVQRQIAAN